MFGDTIQAMVPVFGMRHHTLRMSLKTFCLAIGGKLV
jgi:hypothetical protein